jgi:hypothetical protein
MDASLIRSSPGTGRVGIYIDSAQFSVSPGSSVSIPLIILNQGSVVDHYHVTVMGVPANWLPSLPSDIQLLPGEQRDVILTVQPPKIAKSKAGRYPLALRVGVLNAPENTAEVKVTLTVTSFSQFTSEMRPQKVRTGQTAQVSVQNQGNAQDTFTITWRDRADELAFQPPQAKLTVPEGKSAATEFQVQPRQRRLFGGPKTHTLTKVRPSVPG